MSVQIKEHKMRLSDRLLRLSESETLAMTQKSRELKAQGYDIINLSIGEPDFDTPEHIKEAAKKAIDENWTHYSPVSGYPELLQAICDKFKRENGLEYSPDQIVVSTGAKNSIANVVFSLVSPGDEVIIPAPYWVSYREIVKLARGNCIFVKSSIENDFKFSAEDIEAAITPKTRLIIYSSPCNPTGMVLTKEELYRLAEVVIKYEDLYIISDEIYEHINFVGKHESIAQFDFIKDRVITVNGVSKGYAMTGWRIGYIGAPKWIAKACDKIQGQITSGTCSIAQRAAIAALNSGNETIEEMREIFRCRRDLVLRLLKEIPGIKYNIPQGAFYVFFKVSDYFGKSDGEVTINSADDLCMYLLNKALVATVPGTAFGDPECIRISYATSDALLIKAMDRIKEALIKLH